MAAWFEAHAAAIQAFSALIGLGVTLIYVRLTKSIADSVHRQLAAHLQPVLTIGISRQAIPASNLGSGRVSGMFQICNAGPSPVKIVGMSVVLQSWSYWTNARTRDVQEVFGFANRVLMPQEELRDKYAVESPLAQTNEAAVLTVGMRIECSDLSGVARQLFEFDTENGMRHEFLPAESTTGALARKAKSVRSKMGRWASWENERAEGQKRG